MTILACINPQRGGREALQLAVKLAVTTGEHIVATAVIENPWPPRVQPGSSEYDRLVDAHALAALTEVVASLGNLPGVTITPVAHRAASIPEGILSVARLHGAAVAVLGSSSSGILGRIALGAVTARLVHTAEIPVMLAPRGYRSGLDSFERLTLGYGSDAETVRFLQAGAMQAGKWGLEMRIASFAVRPVPRFGSTRPTMTNEALSREEILLQTWEEETRGQLTDQMTELRKAIDLPRVAFDIGVGNDWQSAVEAVPWQAGDLLALGSAAAGRASQVFLGSAASKIMRYCPVPVMILPRTGA